MANKAVFLDRDDTLIEDPGYINHPDQVKLLAGAAEALIELHKMGYLLVVVSNQSGVARGIVSEESLARIHERMDKLFSYEGANIDAIYYCPYHPNGVIEEYRKESDLRKPAPGMLLLAADEMDIDLEESWMVGNAYRDISAGIRAGCKTILVTSAAKPAQKKPSDPMPYKKAVNIREAVNIIKMYNQQKQAAEVTKESKSRKSKKTRQPSVTGAKPEAASRPEAAEKPDESGISAADSARQMTTQPKQQETSKTGTAKPDASKPKTEKPEPNKSEVKAVESRPQEDKLMKSDQPQSEPAPQAPGGRVPEDHHMHTAHTHRLLEEMLRHLKGAHRENMFHDFSALKMLAGSIQVMVIFCLMVSIWKLLDQTAGAESVHTAIGYAIVLQLMVIAFYLMRDRK